VQKTVDIPVGSVVLRVGFLRTRAAADGALVLARCVAPAFGQGGMSIAAALQVMSRDDLNYLTDAMMSVTQVIPVGMIDKITDKGPRFPCTEAVLDEHFMGNGAGYLEWLGKAVGHNFSHFFPAEDLAILSKEVFVKLMRMAGIELTSNSPDGSPTQGSGTTGG
jgi:hypothetical protein